MTSSVYHVPCIVVGAGVIGLSIARTIAKLGIEVLVLEKGRTIGGETSSRNSEVIHAGIYYEPKSFKSRFCIQGKKMLYDYCLEKSIPFHQCGKLIVATSTDPTHILKLKALQQLAIQNGVRDTKYLTSQDAAIIEPQLLCSAALLVPSTGIVDSHIYMQTLENEAIENGATIVLNTKVVGGKQQQKKILIETDGKDSFSLSCDHLINAAGHEAPKIANYFSNSIYTIKEYAKGNYFKLDGNSPFQHLIYPLPEEGGLGIHSTLDLFGKTRFGPDVEWVQTMHYQVNEERVRLFYQAIASYWPEVKDRTLVTDFAGIRPKLVNRSEKPLDFVIQMEENHGVPGLVNLLGIESPGLTSSLAIASYITKILFPSLHK